MDKVCKEFGANEAQAAHARPEQRARSIDVPNFAYPTSQAVDALLGAHSG